MHAESLQRAIHRWHVQQRLDCAAHVFRMFVLGDPVSRAEAEAALGANLLGTLSTSGLMVATAEDGIVSAFVLRMYRGFLVLCDDLEHFGDSVYGSGHGTQAFSDFAADARIGRALDLGCGAGAVALWLSARADCVVATDVNPRALAFVAINACLNGVTNVTTRLGSLLDPVAGETFDFIASQPPYVPKAAGMEPATYLYGGPSGNELVALLMSGLPAHLNPGGRAMVVFEQPMPEVGDGGLGALSRSDQDGLQFLFVLGDEVDADAYAMRHAAPSLRSGIDAFDGAVTTMRAHLAAMGIRGLCPAVCAIARDGGVGWSATVRAGDAIWSEVSGAMIARLMTAQNALHGQTPETSVALPTGCLLIRPAAGPPDADLYLGMPRGYPLSSLRLSAADWEAIQQSNAAVSLPTELRVRLADAGLLGGHA
jgi:SAM-dependent methyltransferase